VFVTEPWWLQTYIVFTQGAEKFFFGGPNVATHMFFDYSNIYICIYTGWHVTTHVPNLQWKSYGFVLPLGMHPGLRAQGVLLHPSGQARHHL
jgi:hypothetical protein